MTRSKRLKIGTRAFYLGNGDREICTITGIDQKHGELVYIATLTEGEPQIWGYANQFVAA